MARNKRKGKYKSGLELWFATLAKKEGMVAEYEAESFAYVRPSHYNPDWKIAPNVFIETKGYFPRAQRANLLAFKEQYPKVRILLLFGNAQNKLSAKAKTTYAQWADKHGFEWADVKSGLPFRWWKKYAVKK